MSVDELHSHAMASNADRSLSQNRTVCHFIGGERRRRSGECPGDQPYYCSDAPMLSQEIQGNTSLVLLVLMEVVLETEIRTSNADRRETDRDPWRGRK